MGSGALFCPVLTLHLQSADRIPLVLHRGEDLGLVPA